jgi:hypothetical protein
MAAILALLALAGQEAAPAADWRLWRGPAGNGIAAAGQDPPSTWSDTENVLWKAEVPGRGHSSPTVVGDRIFLTTADDERQVQSVVAFDRATGGLSWKADLHEGGFPRKIHVRNSHATCSVVSDGERLFASFFNREAVHVTALGLDGRKVWQTTVGPLRPKQYEHGYAPSPALYKSLVVVAVDSDEGGFLTALDAKTGRPKWRTPRPAKTSFATPVVARLSGRDQLLLSGCEIVAAYDPATGKPLWSSEATTIATCGTIVWDGDLVFASGGYPKSETAAVRADGSGRVAWRNTRKCYEQSLLAHEGYVYAVDDAGIAFCWKAADGSEAWNARLAKSSSSPVLAAGRIYVSSDRGTTFVFRADPREYKEIARNRLGDDASASPTICGGRIYLRVGRSEGGRRREFLYSIGSP